MSDDDCRGDALEGGGVIRQGTTDGSEGEGRVGEERG